MKRLSWRVAAAVLTLSAAGINTGRAQSPATELRAVPTDPSLAGEMWGPGVMAEKVEGHAGGHSTQDPPDLTLANFFSAGWDEAYTRRSSEDRAPDLALLRVQTNFMEREVRFNYAFTDNINNAKRKELDNLDGFIAYAFNRRFMFEVLGNFQWEEGRAKTPDISGPEVRLVGRVQLISTAMSSYTFNFQVISPNDALGVRQTSFGYGMAGFEDLTYVGLYRVGLYYSFLFDTLAGPGEAGAEHDDVQYDVTIAKTFTRPDTPFVGNLTLFAEMFAQTMMDGDTSGRTLASVTPGIRFNLGKVHGCEFGLDNWIMMGVDIPVAGPRPWDAIYRLTYIKNF